MGMLRIKYINATAGISTYKVTGEIENGTNIIFSTPRQDQDDVSITANLVAGKLTANYIRESLYTNMIKEGYLVGRLNTETSATFFKIQSLDLANPVLPILTVGAGYVTDELADDADVDADDAAFEPTSTTYDQGDSYLIPIDKIFSVKRDGDTNIKLTFFETHSSSKVITFTPGTIKTTAINRIAIEASDGDNTSSLQEVPVTANYFSNPAEDLDELEATIVKALEAAEGDSLVDLNVDTKKIALTTVSG
jgi:hypothetical protein